MATFVRPNERSWVIDLISEINSFVSVHSLRIKHAGGERTVSQGRTTMFPDIILYGDKSQQVILQGWEAKMPDIPIENEEFIKDAQRKAAALGLNSCLIWNFTYAVLYVKNEDDTFSIVRQWNETSFIRTRADVERFRNEWCALIKQIILEVNDYFTRGTFREASVGEVISNTTVTDLIRRNKSLVASYLKKRATENSIIEAEIANWWQDVKLEYQNDEQDRYMAYAKVVILNWINRIVFAHLIKRFQNSAKIIDDLSVDTNPIEANKIFDAITQKCDFYNIFASPKYNELLPQESWQDFLDLSLFLRDNGIDKLEQRLLQNILEKSVHITKRELNGQFTTPPMLAQILTEITIHDWNAPVIDPCCGTGTIAKMALDIKKEKIGVRLAVESVWASDKNKFPLQVANISLTDEKSINLANRIFQHNALTLKVGEQIELVDPATGERLKLSLPAFGSVVSNLPFVAFESIGQDDKGVVSASSDLAGLNEKSDLYCYIALKLADIMRPGGFLGFISSNSWLVTIAGSRFVESLKSRYEICQVHVSVNGRWFSNADVVTTILILKKKNEKPCASVRFFAWQKPLPYFESNSEAKNILVRSSLLNRELDSSIVRVSSYTSEQISELLSVDLSYNAFFHRIDWLKHFYDKIIPINQVYDVFRGSRRGWDSMFFPKRGEHHIESEYLEPVLMNARNVHFLHTTAEEDAFCCSDSIEDLIENKKVGALSWIEKFQHQVNKVGKPLPDVLRRPKIHWYELQKNEIAEVFTMMNPDKRFFFAKFDRPSFINQRLIGLCHKPGFSDEELNHALINSVLTMFFIEGRGFGRGLGVLDINKDNVAACRMFNPNLLSSEQKACIIEKFARLKKRKIEETSKELFSNDRVEFEKEVFRCFGVEEYFESVRDSLLSMQAARHSVKS